MTTTVQRAALVFGIVFLVVGILGFVTTGMNMEADPGAAPKLLGLFPVNLLHNLVHLAFGGAGIALSRTWTGARSYCRAGGVIYLVLAVLGLVAPSTFGLLPIGGNDVWLHALLGGVMAAVGFTARGPAAEAGIPTTAV